MPTSIDREQVISATKWCIQILKKFENDQIEQHTEERVGQVKKARRVKRKGVKSEGRLKSEKSMLRELPDRYVERKQMKE